MATTYLRRRHLGLPTSLDVSNYRRVWADASFSTYFVNSVLVTVSAVTLCTVVSLLAAYPLGRYRFRGVSLLTAYFIAGMMLPIRLGIVPVFYLLASLGRTSLRRRLGSTGQGSSASSEP